MPDQRTPQSIRSGGQVAGPSDHTLPRVPVRLLPGSSGDSSVSKDTVQSVTGGDYRFECHRQMRRRRICHCLERGERCDSKDQKCRADHLAE